MLKRIFPIATQLSRYTQQQLYKDAKAGLTVGVMLIPQGMAYALIAGLPPIYGLYASLVPTLIYSLLGTSRQLSVAPVAMMSLLTAAGVAPLAGGDIERYITLAVLLALLIGGIQFIMGIARFGFLTNFLAHPILSGFTSAAALIIGFSQVKHLLGVEITRSHYVHEIIIQLFQSFEQVQPWAFLIGVLSIALLVGLKIWKSSFPAALIVVALSTLCVWLFDLGARGVSIVEHVPEGLPGFSVPLITLADVESLLPIALAIALVGFMESIAVANVYASKNQYEVDANKELVGLGLANVFGSFFQAFPVTGGFSRTAVNAEAGAVSQVSGLITVGVIGLTLLFLTPLFYFLPKAVLAAIILVAVIGLFDWKEARYLWRVDRKDFALMGLTFIATLGLGIELGILLGVAISLLMVLQQSARPHTAVEGRLPGTDTFRNLKRNSDAREVPGIKVFRMDASLYFANIRHFKKKVREAINGNSDIQVLVLNFFPVNRIDSSAAHALRDMLEALRLKGIQLLFAGVKGPVKDMLQKADLIPLIGTANFHNEVHEAVGFAAGLVDLNAMPARNGQDRLNHSYSEE